MYRVNKMSEHIQAQHFYDTYEEAINAAFDNQVMWNEVKVYDHKGECVYNHKKGY